MNTKLKKRLLPLFVVLAVLVVLRLLLPYFVTRYVNKTLAQLEDYEGSISDVDLFLLGGSYSICDLRLDKVTGDLKEPFVRIPRSDLSVQWAALFDGAIVGEVELLEPELNFVLGPTEASSQTGTEEDWVQLVQDLMPIQINRFAANNAVFGFAYTGSEPTYAIDFKNFDLEVTNIRNVEDREEALPSVITATGYSPSYSGYMRMDARAFFLKEIPDFDYNMRFEDIKLESLNPLFQYYAGMDFERGSMNLFSELALKDGQFDGYFKPIVKDARIFKWKEEDRRLGQGIKEFFAEGIQELFENRFGGKEQTASKIPIAGSVEATKTEIWPSILTAFKNAYISALKEKVDDTVNFKSIESEDKEEKKGFLKKMFSQK